MHVPTSATATVGRRVPVVEITLAVLVLIAIGGLLFIVFEQRNANKLILGQLDGLRVAIDRQAAESRALGDQVASLSGRILELERDNKDLRRRLIALQRRRPTEVATSTLIAPLESSPLPLYAENPSIADPDTLIAVLPITWATNWTSYQPAGILAPSPRIVIPRKLADPAFLKALYVSHGLLQAADVLTTFAALGRGAREGNPLVRNVVHNRPLFIGVKAVTSVATVFAVERLRKRSPVGASVTLIAINATLAAVAVNNLAIAR
jgi:hypothetical protein